MKKNYEVEVRLTENALFHVDAESFEDAEKEFKRFGIEKFKEWLDDVWDSCVELSIEDVTEYDEL